MKTQEAPKARRFRFNRWGLAENPLLHYVAMPWQGRELLGTVTDCQYNDVRGVFVLTVKHFNGEPWPVQPIASAVEVLDGQEHLCLEIPARQSSVKTL